MKRKITLVFIIALVVGGMVGFAGDGNDDNGRWRNRCDPAGTWFEEPGPPYMAIITPIQGHSRYSIFFQGLYEASLFGFEIMTPWSGELVKSGDGYDVAIITILGGEGVDGGPPWANLQTWGVKGHIEFSEDCNTIDVTWPGSIYAWVWDGTPVTPPIPWVDLPDDRPWGTGTLYETYHRMIMPTDYSDD